MSTKPLFLLRKAKKSSGEPDVVLWASNDFESTCATLDYLIVKSGKKLSSYFKAVATNFPVVNDLPAEGGGPAGGPALPQLANPRCL